jgi:hypothetical protein
MKKQTNQKKIQIVSLFLAANQKRQVLGLGDPQ